MSKSILLGAALLFAASCRPEVDKSGWVIPPVPDEREEDGSRLVNFAAGKFYLFNPSESASYQDRYSVLPWSSGTFLTDEEVLEGKGVGAVAWKEPEVEIVLDLGSTRTVDVVKIHALSDMQTASLPESVRIFHSIGKEQAWTESEPLSTFGVDDGQAGWGIADIAGTSCRYLKLLVVSSDTTRLMMLDEIEAWGPFKEDPKYVPADGAYHGAFNNATSFADNTDPRWVVTNRTCPVDTYEQAVGKRVSMALWYQNMEEGRNFAEIRQVRDEYLAVEGGGHRFLIYGWLPTVSARDWATGALDSYLERYFSDVAAPDVKDNGPIWFRPANEMNGGWCPYSLDTENYVRAWRRMYNIAEQYGVTSYHVFVWSPNAFDSPATPANTLSRYYPGDIYVDWLGLSLYPPSSASGFAESQRYPYTLVQAVKKISQGKPILVTEGGFSSDYGQSAENMSSAQKYACDHLRWVREWFGLKDKEPRIKGLIWENHCSSSAGDRRIHQDPDALAVYQELVKDPYWLSEIPDDVVSEMERRK
ncbi:MAG: endoglucanase [Bacteroidales bacterium]|nr:endoglucanase [Bacteroidales bacterium]